jgi:histidinol-phosphatase (PHP family)
MYMLIDYHSHHERCGHAVGNLEEMVQAAIEKGIHQFGMSDHSPFFCEEDDHPLPGITMPKSEFSAYVQEMHELKEKYAEQIDLRLGVEADYLPGLTEVYREILDQYAFDYIIGSVHYFGGYHVYDPTRWQNTDLDVNDVYVQYYRHIQDAVRSGMFDILAHLDAIKARSPQATIDLGKVMDETAQAIKEADIAVELNSSGIRKCDEIFPSMEFLERLHHLNVPFTYGSDCHHPTEIGYGRETVSKILKMLGVKEVATFKNRSRIMLPLEEMSSSPTVHK